MSTFLFGTVLRSVMMFRLLCWLFHYIGDSMREILYNLIGSLADLILYDLFVLLSVNLAESKTSGRAKWLYMGLKTALVLDVLVSVFLLLTSWQGRNRILF